MPSIKKEFPKFLGGIAIVVFAFGFMFTCGEPIEKVYIPAARNALERSGIELPSIDFETDPSKRMYNACVRAEKKIAEGRLLTKMEMEMVPYAAICNCVVQQLPVAQLTDAAFNDIITLFDDIASGHGPSKGESTARGVGGATYSSCATAATRKSPNPGMKGSDVGRQSPKLGRGIDMAATQKSPNSGMKGSDVERQSPKLGRGIDEEQLYAFAEGQAKNENCSFYKEATSIARGALAADRSNYAAMLYTVEGCGGGGNNSERRLALFVSQPTKLALVAYAVVSSRMSGAFDEVKIANGQILLNGMALGPDDPLCCPSSPVTATYELYANRLVQKSGARLDR